MVALLLDMPESYSHRICRCGASMRPLSDGPDRRWRCEECGRTAR